MAQIQKKIQKKTRSQTTCFGCFGFSGEEVFDQMSPEKVGGYGKRKKSRWFSWRLKFRMKRPPSTKTVPVSDRPTQNHIHIEARASSRAKSDNLTTAASKRHPPMNSDQDIIDEPQQIQTKYRNEQSRHLDSLEDDTCQELERMLPTTRKLPCKKTGQRSLPGSPGSKFNSGPITAVISHPVRKNRQTQRGNAASVVHPSMTTSKAIGKFDTVAVGMSIIMVTLVVMMLWGRLCAIFCTSAWLYFIPRLRTTTTTTTMITINGVKNQSNSKHELMDSNEYKKKVVMKGFLERNRRSSNNMMRIL